MTNWFTCKQGEVRCVRCDAILMTEKENKDLAPPTAGLYTSSNAAENWWAHCECGSGNLETHGGMKPD